jgi:hypothetical protein
MPHHDPEATMHLINAAVDLANAAYSVGAYADRTKDRKARRLLKLIQDCQEQISYLDRDIISR